jgi:hypothetical protein
MSIQGIPESERPAIRGKRCQPLDGVTPRRVHYLEGCPELDTRNHPAPEQGWGRLTSRGRGPSRGSGRGHPGGPGPSRRARASGPRRGGRRRNSCRRGSGPSPS